jgi:hypothetical protein
MASCSRLKLAMLCTSYSDSMRSTIADHSQRHTTVTLGFHHDEVAFAEEARRHARKHGYKTRQDWKIELLDLGEEDEGEVY